MPWQSVGDTVRFSGQLHFWTLALEEWHKEDAATLGDQVDLWTYFGRMAVLCAEKAKKQWSSQMFGGRTKVSKLEAFFTPGQGGNTGINTLDVLDYLAENVGLPDLIMWGPSLRQMVKNWK